MNGRSIRWAFNFGSWHPSESQFQLAVSCIQDEEKKRIGRFVFKKDAKASLIGRLLMRKFVHENGGLPYARIKFERDERGKPYLVGGLKEDVLHFNVSHQGNYAVIAGDVCSNMKLGVDIMKLEYSGGKDLSEFFRIMTRHFSPSEWVNIKGNYEASDEKKIAMFCRHWCLKESYVKAIGTGITVDLQRICFKVKTTDLMVGVVTTDTELYVNGSFLNEWIFEESLLDEEHCVAVAVKSNVKNSAPCNVFKFLDFDELMHGCEPLTSADIDYSRNFFRKDEKPFQS